ncbi:MAG: response regulator [Methylococcaceae bacterium]|nr:MAG: response regulator [Methylococcaceae bacterium]
MLPTTPSNRCRGSAGCRRRHNAMQAWFSKLCRPWVRLRLWMSHSLRHRILVFTLLPTVGFSALVGVASYLVVDRLMRDQLMEELAIDLRIVKWRVAQRLNENNETLRRLADNPLLANGLTDSVGRETYLLPFFREHVLARQAEAELVLTDFRGSLLASSVDGPAVWLNDLHGLKSVLNSQQATAEWLPHAEGRDLILIYPVIFPPTHSVEGLLVYRLSLRRWLQGIDDDVRSRLLLRDTDNTDILGGASAPRRRLELQERLVLTAPVERLALTAAVVYDRDQAFAPLYRMACWYLAFGLLLTGMAGWLGSAVTRRLTGDLVNLAKQTDAIRGTEGWADYDLRLGMREDEIGRVAAAFQQLLERLRLSYQGLEAKIAERTAALTSVNASLRHEIEVRREAEIALAESEKRLLNAKEKAERASRLKSEFLSNVSHEIRTPMNGIMGLTQLVLDSELTPMQRDYLNKVASSSQALLGVINDILDFSKIEAGRMALEANAFDLQELLQGVVDLFAIAAERKGLFLRFEVAPQAPARLIGDAMRLGQVLNNLVGNALKFTESGGVVLKVHSEALPEEQVQLQFSVIDTGIGMSREQLAGLFQPFTQADGTITRRFGGTGLGLSICKNLVRMMGGDISVQTAWGKGSEFSFHIRLPRAVVPAEPVKTHGRFAAGAFAGNKVLLVEDNEVNRIVAITYLKRCKVAVTVAVDGLEAVDRVRREHFDLVLMDLQMPEMDGMEATRIIRTLPGCQALPIIAMTAAAMTQDKEECLAAGMNDHIAKPFNPGQLTDVLGKWLAPKC